MDLSELKAECNAKYSKAITWFKAQDLLVQANLNVGIQPIQQDSVPDTLSIGVENLQIQD